MKFNCGETWEEKSKRRDRWHDWFAWYPVRVGPRDCRWLEVVERVIYSNNTCFYRAKDEVNNGN